MTASTDVAGYLARVRAALADLPARTRDELLEDLPDHLAEIAAEGDEPLESRLGPPEAYAAELRAGADLRSTGRPLAAKLTAAVDTVRGRLRVWDTKIGSLLGYEMASDFLRLLRPGWWVLRGYLAAMVVVSLLDEGPPVGLVPRLGGSTIAALAILAGFIVGSIWLGRRTDRLARWPRRALGAGTALLILAGLSGFVHADGATRSEGFAPAYVYANPYDSIRDVYVYDENGRLVYNARLFDQDGRPIELGAWYGWCEPPDAGRPHRANLYPRCPQNAPFGRPQASPGPSSSPAPTTDADRPEPDPGPS